MSSPAFLSSSAFLLGMLAATLAGQYPFWLRSTLDPSYSLTALNSASDHYGLRRGADLVARRDRAGRRLFHLSVSLDAGKSRRGTRAVIRAGRRRPGRFARK